ncbi:MAG: dihydrofolate reductase family protein, partial [Verrucomicrobia bacterium]|nr:dihydrofolate reductase family protein [Verrucomicrobiota bacterium]
IQVVGPAEDRLAAACVRLNEAFNHWIVHRTPFVTVKAAMTLDGKIATARGESRWITGQLARAHGMALRRGADAVLVGINTVLADDPSLTVRHPHAAFRTPPSARRLRESNVQGRGPRCPRRRIVLDSRARTPLAAKVVSDDWAGLTTIVVGRRAPAKRVAALARRAVVWRAPVRDGRIDLRWLLRRLGRQQVTSLLVEGGGEVNAAFLLAGLAHRVAFFYAPKILGGRDARKAIAGDGARRRSEALPLRQPEWRRLGQDWLLTARVEEPR